MKKLSAYLLLLSLIIIFISACSSGSDTPPVTPSPPSVVGVQLRADAGDGQVTLYWPMVPGADTYNIYMGTSISSLTKINTTPATLTSAPYTVTGLTNGMKYYFAFTAVSTSNGESALSEVISAIPQGDPDPVPPEFPKNVRANAGVSEVTVTWTPVDDAEVYNLYQYSNLNDLTLAAEVKSTDCTSSQCSFTVTGLTNGITYFFFLTAENNTSANSAVVSATPPSTSSSTILSGDPVTVPQDVLATASEAKITLSWTAPTGATPNTIYNVYWNRNVDPFATDQKIPGRTSPWEFSGLTNGTTYSFYLTAVLGSGPSFGTYATPSANPPPEAPFITAVTPGDGTVRIDWNTVTGAASYNVYSSNVMGLSKEVYSGKATGAGNSFTATDLTNDTKYYFVVTAVNAAGSESAESYEVWATPSASSSSSGIAGISYMSGLQLNPSGSLIIYAH
jgi:fibronectin type 3 domain-containing protein